MKKKVAFCIDGEFMWKVISDKKTKNTFNYTGKNIRNYCEQHIGDDQEIYRIFYYDSRPLDRKGTSPISKTTFDFSTTSGYKRRHDFFNMLRVTPNFALRLGTTEWNNEWMFKNEITEKLLNKEITIDDLEEKKDFSPQIRQKGVDMKIGIDITLLALKRLVDIIVIITGDQDIVPALKLARREGIMVGLDHLKMKVNLNLLEHVDYVRTYM